jgi:hypothetical protein
VHGEDEGGGRVDGERWAVGLLDLDFGSGDLRCARSVGTDSRGATGRVDEERVDDLPVRRGGVGVADGRIAAGRPNVAVFPYAEMKSGQHVHPEST